MVNSHSKYEGGNARADGHPERRLARVRPHRECASCLFEGLHLPNA